MNTPLSSAFESLISEAIKHEIREYETYDFIDNVF